ncbi:MAG TPA: phage major capsid protein [Lachnospiraceae bacterium]|nr:phage major capsid protein [Lachnospiraceae bacterium]
MALRALMLRKKIDMSKKALEELRKKENDFQTREAELETAINEAETDEEKTVVEGEVEQFESEKKEHEEETGKLEKELERLEAELKEEEKRTSKLEVQMKEQQTEVKNEREGVPVMSKRAKFYGLSIQEREAFFAREEIKNFVSTVRTAIKEKRGITNVGLVIPEVMLELLKTKVEETSKLLKYVTVRPVTGKARQRIMGVIPEGIWTEMCASLNELDLSFNDTEVDGFKVGGYFAVHNAIIEDNDVNLVSEIINALGKAIGKALDKAIVYGTGTKMPLGIVTRLAQKTEPSDYPATSRKWVDLSTSNITKGTGAVGLKLFQEILGKTKSITNDYSETGLIWIMNKNTHTDLIIQSMDKNATAAIVAGMNMTMPVIGGDIVELNCIPDGDIIFGYADMYLLVERAGTELATSEHTRFLEDQTVFKGTARYDGKPVIAEAFALTNIGNVVPTTTIAFAPDKQNDIVTAGGSDVSE